MKQFGLFICVLIISGWGFGQNAKFDKLEMLFEQGHYKRVNRQANRLLDDPQYDFSHLPKYYKSLSLLQLSQNKYWLRNHEESLDEAEKLFLEVKKSSDAYKIFTAHQYELSWVKEDIVSWASDLKRMGEDAQFQRVQELIDVLFEGIDLLDKENPFPIEDVDTADVRDPNMPLREEIILVAKQQLGVPYVWAGNSPEGFDCSGFTSYVMEKNGKKLPRRAVDQFNQSKKVKEKNVQKGDLIFFDNGSGISHVGIVISDKNEDLKMIHSSSSQGIIITNITKSEYWKSRLYGFGSYVD